MVRSELIGFLPERDAIYPHRGHRFGFHAPTSFCGPVVRSLAMGHGCYDGPFPLGFRAGDGRFAHIGMGRHLVVYARYLRFLGCSVARFPVDLGTGCPIRRYVVVLPFHAWLSRCDRS